MKRRNTAISCGRNVWLVIPSARPAAEIKDRLQLWHDMGYHIALWRNGPHRHDDLPDYVWLCENTPEYAGWGPSINQIAKGVFLFDRKCDWVVGGGDDTDPEPVKTADVIAAECTAHFAGTFGVMQPTGDRWGADEPWARARFPQASAYIDRICGSPWIGREFARRMNQGIGPFWPEYAHMFADEELQQVAQRMGVLWQRPDLTHQHHHPARVNNNPNREELQQAIYSSEHWGQSQELFNTRKAAGFPGSEPIA